MKTLGILVLGVVLGLVGAGAAVKYSPQVQKVLGVHAAHAVVAQCDCKNCDCKCANCTCTACPGKQNQDPKKECGTPPAKKGCCENHK